jgi:multisubunit Na+/H+ antiporter MnhE subunit
MMFRAVAILCLTAVFALTLGDFKWQNLVIGVVLSSFLVAIYRDKIVPKPPPRNEFVMHIIVRLPKVLAMLAWDILKGTWLVTAFVLGLRKLDHPGIVRIPLGNHSPPGVGVVGLFITMSPGTFLVDIDWNERYMLVHTIDATDPDGIRQDAERYYKLWEYGTHIPIVMPDSPDHGGAS